VATGRTDGGGEAGSESTPGVGSTFWFTTTLKKSAETFEAKLTTNVDAEVVIRKHYAGCRILIADDEPGNGLPDNRGLPGYESRVGLFALSPETAGMRENCPTCFTCRRSAMAIAWWSHRHASLVISPPTGRDIPRHTTYGADRTADGKSVRSAAMFVP
jgi:hypothetical protein